MTQSVTPALREIVAALKAAMPGVDFMVGDYVMDSYVPKVDADGLFRPYCLLKVHTSYETADNGICEKDADPLKASFSLYMVAPDGWVVQELADEIRATLRGKRFTDTDALLVSGGYSFVDADLGYHRYVQNIGFTFRHNLANGL